MQRDIEDRLIELVWGDEGQPQAQIGIGGLEPAERERCIPIGGLRAHGLTVSSKFPGEIGLMSNRSMVAPPLIRNTPGLVSMLELASMLGSSEVREGWLCRPSRIEIRPRRDPPPKPFRGGMGCRSGSGLTGMRAELERRNLVLGCQRSREVGIDDVENRNLRAVGCP